MSSLRHSTMEVTLPLVSEGQQYTPQAEGIPDPPQKKDGNHNTIIGGNSHRTALVGTVK